MYGGLFGDLPAAKNATNNGNNNNNDITTEGSLNSSNTTTSSVDVHLHQDLTGNVNTLQQQQQQEKSTPIMIPHRIIPTHAIRPRQQQYIQQQNHQRIIPKKRPVPLQPQSQPSQSQEPIQTQIKDVNSTLVSTNTSKAIDTTTPNKLQQQQHHNMDHDDVNTNDSNNITFQVISSVNDTDKEKIYDNSNNIQTIDNDQQQQQKEQQQQQQQQQQKEYEDHIRTLHEQAIINNDVYNPMIPNDVLLYWDHQIMIIQQKQIEQQRQQMIHEQDLLRQQLEQERTILLQQAIQEDTKKQKNNSNDNTNDNNNTNTFHTTDSNNNNNNSNVYYQKIIEQEQQRTIGMGRGNIKSNLPAWLVQKQREREQQQEEEKDQS